MVSSAELILAQLTPIDSEFIAEIHSNLSAIIPLSSAKADD